MIVVTTPTGSIGHRVVEDLLAAGERVRVIARDPARLAASVRDRVEVVVGSQDDPDVLDRAFAGAEALFWLVPPNFRAASLEDAYVGFTRPAAEAIPRHRIPRVVLVSALGRGTGHEENAGLVTAALAVEDLLAGTGAALRTLALPSFMDNLLRQVDSIRDSGTIVGTIDPDRRSPTCATRDIAAVAADLLRDRTWRGRESVAVLGPEDLSFDEMATIVGEVLGRPVRYRQVPLEAFRARLRESGASEAVAEAYVAMMAAKNAGLDDGVARTVETASPTSFRTWCEEFLRPAVLGRGDGSPSP